MSHRKS